MKNKQYPLYSLPLISDIKDMLKQRLQAVPDSYAFSFTVGNEIVRKSTADFCSDVDAFGTYLTENGYSGKHIAVIGENSYEWLTAFTALINGGCVAVPIDKEYTKSEISELLAKSDCAAVIISKGYIDLVEESDSLTVISLGNFSEYIAEGNRLLNSGAISYTNYTIDRNKLAAIFFTSGTTGTSKGVMLSHKNMAEDINYACKNFELTGDTLAVLPFHHTFGLITAIYKVFNYRKGTYINKSLKRIKNDIAISKPQTIFMVPLFVETFYKQIIDTAEKGGKLKKMQTGAKLSNLLLKVGIDKRRKLFSEVLNAFGGNIEYIICGGAPLQIKYIQAFRSWGITILNGYGITECSPVVSVNRNHYIRDGSVGYVLDGCSVKSDADGEVLIKGDNVMLGYYKDDNATKSSITDGWYHTGDLGYVDNDGFLFLTGRKKNLIILSNGENVSPEEIEARIAVYDEVNEVVVYEDGGSIIAEIFPAENYIGNQTYFNELLKKVNNGQPKFKQISRIILRDSEFPKNTTKKIVRYKIKEEHKNDK